MQAPMAKHSGKVCSHTGCLPLIKSISCCSNASPWPVSPWPWTCCHGQPAVPTASVSPAVAGRRPRAQRPWAGTGGHRLSPGVAVTRPAGHLRGLRTPLKYPVLDRLLSDCAAHGMAGWLVERRLVPGRAGVLDDYGCSVHPEQRAVCPSAARKPALLRPASPSTVTGSVPPARTAPWN